MANEHNIYIPEWEIEIALIWNPDLLRIPRFTGKLEFIENQKRLNSNSRIDILYKCSDNCVIAEIKCTYVEDPSIVKNQVLRYRKDFSRIMDIPEKNIICALVTTVGFSDELVNLCRLNRIHPITLDPEEVIKSAPPFDSSSVQQQHNSLLTTLYTRRPDISATDVIKQKITDPVLALDIESIKAWQESGIHDHTARKKIADIFADLSESAPIRAHEINIHGFDGKLLDQRDVWFWLFYSVLDRRSNAALFINARKALEAKNLFLPDQLTVLEDAIGTEKTINTIAEILTEAKFPLMCDSSMGYSAQPRSILEAADYMKRYDYSFDILYNKHLEAQSENLEKVCNSIRMDIQKSVYGAGPRISCQFVRGMVLKGPWNLPLTDNKFLEACPFNIRFASIARIGLIQNVGEYETELGKFADQYLGGNRGIISHALWYIRKKYCDRITNCEQCKLTGYCNHHTKKERKKNITRESLLWYT